MAFIYGHRVGFHDTDGAGVVYFANGLTLCHLAYEASLAAAGVDLTRFFPRGAIAAELAYPIVHASIDFMGPIAGGDDLTITVSPFQIHDSQFENHYTLALASAPGRVVARALTRHVCIRTATRQRHPLPDEILTWLQRFGDRAIK